VDKYVFSSLDSQDFDKNFALQFVQMSFNHWGQINRRQFKKILIGQV
jgi:hypothetical protein